MTTVEWLLKFNTVKFDPSRLNKIHFSPKSISINSKLHYVPFAAPLTTPKYREIFILKIDFFDSKVQKAENILRHRHLQQLDVTCMTLTRLK